MSRTQRDCAVSQVMKQAESQARRRLDAIRSDPLNSGIHVTQPKLVRVILDEEG